MGLYRYIDLSTPEEIRVTPGCQDDNKFDKRMVGKWQDVIFSKHTDNVDNERQYSQRKIRE